MMSYLFLRLSGLVRTSSFLTSVVLLAKEVELRIFFPAPDRDHMSPMAGSGRFASTPASFRAMRRERAEPRLRKQNRLAQTGNAPMARTQPSALEKPAIDKAARRKLECVVPDSPVLTS